MSDTKLKEGTKFDQGKTRYDFWSPYALEEVSKVQTYGALKYEDHNWAKGIKYSRVFSALMRHIWAWFRGERNDPETGFNHLAHAMCCVMYILHYDLMSEKYQEYDDRPKWDEF